MSLSPSTWRLLGLSIAAVYTGLGAWGVLAPLPFAEGFLGGKPKLIRRAATDQVQADAVDVAQDLAPAMASRDLSIGLALFALHHQEQPRAFGTLVLGGLVLCVEDTLIQFRRGNTGVGAFFAFGVALWTGIGWAMATGKAD